MGASCDCKLLVFIILFGASSSAAAAGVSKDPDDVAKWVHKTQFAKQKVTKLHFFFHDTTSGENPTTLPIAKSAVSGNNSLGAFGTLSMADDPLTVDPRVNSTTIGYARGLYGVDGRKDMGMVMAMNFVFTSRKYNGSTLAMVGHNAATESPREMPILGGTGLFRLARGVAIANTYYSKGFDAIVEYNVAFLHY
uniref:Dirigent protein n=1 Tax=Kalanchoe fedtschenkoi TaxID=63787 RepID=A0A7N0V7T3_KALFE